VLACHAIFILIMAGVGVWMKLGAIYYLGLVLAALCVVMQYQWIRTRQREACFKAFMNNNWMGAAVFAGLALDYLFRVPLFKTAP
jgi:4-hydroxybenzoate polyprenyltransferase